MQEICSGKSHNESTAGLVNSRGHGQEAEDDAGAGDLNAEGCTTRTMLVNQSELESTGDVVNGEQHGANNDHKLASEKVLLRKACLE